MINLRTDIVKIRKEHKCLACCRSFPKGTEMQLQVNIDEGRIFNVYLCDTCEDLMRNYPNLFGYEGEFEKGCVKGEIIECNATTPEELLSELENCKYVDCYDN